MIQKKTLAPKSVEWLYIYQPKHESLHQITESAPRSQKIQGISS